MDIATAKATINTYAPLLFGKQYPKGGKYYIGHLTAVPDDRPSEYMDWLNQGYFSAWENYWHEKGKWPDNLHVEVICGYRDTEGIVIYSCHFLEDVLKEMELK